MLPSRRSSQLIAEQAGFRLDRKLIAEHGTIPAGLRMIQDTFPFEIIDKKEAMSEDAYGHKTPCIRISGLIQMGDKENANGRLYPTSDVLTPAVRNVQEDLSSRAVMGEFDHPSDAKIHLDRVSHLMTKVWMDGRKVFGEAEILHKMPCGAMLRGLFEHKVRVGISSRGVGDMEIVENNGRELYRVMPGYAFVTWDAVAEPSVSGAILNIQEGLLKAVRPLAQKKSKFSPEVYQRLFVEEIDKYFGLNKKKVIVAAHRK